MPDHTVHGNCGRETKRTMKPCRMDVGREKACNIGYYGMAGEWTDSGMWGRRKRANVGMGNDWASIGMRREWDGISSCRGGAGKKVGQKLATAKVRKSRTGMKYHFPPRFSLFPFSYHPDLSFLRPYLYRAEPLKNLEKIGGPRRIICNLIACQVDECSLSHIILRSTFI